MRQNVIMNYMSNPYQYSNFGYAQSVPTQQLIKVTGIDGAKAYSLPPNSSVALFHESENLMYVKTTDGAGFPTIRTFKFDEVTEQPMQTVDMTEYVTRSELAEILKEYKNGKSSISRPKSE